MKNGRGRLPPAFDTNPYDRSRCWNTPFDEALSQPPVSFADLIAGQVTGAYVRDFLATERSAPQHRAVAQPRKHLMDHRYIPHA